MRGLALPVDERDCFPRRVLDKGEIPSEFRRSTGLSEGTETIYCPPDQWGPRITPPTLIVAGTHSLLIERLLETRFDRTEIDYGAITNIQAGRILLYSWLIFEWQQSGGTSGQTTIEFNTVASQLMLELLRRIRREAFPSTMQEETDIGSGSEPAATPSSTNPGPDVPRRLRLAWREVAFPEQPPVTAAYYPGDSVQHAGQLIVLTDTEVVDIQALANSVWGSRNYGVQWTFLPVAS